MKVKQDIMRLQERAQGIGNAVFIIHRLGLGPQITIEVSITGSPHFDVSQRVGDRDESDLPAGQLQITPVKLGHNALNGQRATNFIAMNGTQYDQAGPAFEARISVGAQGSQAGAVSGHGSGS
jgi:hypothetical protein